MKLNVIESDLALDYADNATTQQLVSFLSNSAELTRLNKHRAESRSRASLNKIINRAIELRAESNG